MVREVFVFLKFGYMPGQLIETTLGTHKVYNFVFDSRTSEPTPRISTKCIPEEDE